jgi:hypothetical protein
MLFLFSSEIRVKVSHNQADTVLNPLKGTRYTDIMETSGEDHPMIDDIRRLTRPHHAPAPGTQHPGQPEANPETPAQSHQPALSDRQMAADDVLRHFNIASDGVRQSMSVNTHFARFGQLMKRINTTIDAEGFQLSPQAKQTLAVRVANRLMDRL